MSDISIRNVTNDIVAKRDDSLQPARHVTEDLYSAPLFLVGPGDASTTLWLHARQKRTCWYFKALYEYEAFVTVGEDPGSPRHSVDGMDLT